MKNQEEKFLKRNIPIREFTGQTAAHFITALPEIPLKHTAFTAGKENLQ